MTLSGAWSNVVRMRCWQGVRCRGKRSGRFFRHCVPGKMRSPEHGSISEGFICNTPTYTGGRMAACAVSGDARVTKQHSVILLVLRADKKYVIDDSSPMSDDSRHDSTK